MMMMLVGTTIVSQIFVFGSGRGAVPDTVLEP